MFVKVCGITRLTDALHAVEQGATALGFIFWPRSPRAVSPERAAEIVAELPSSITTFGVFVNEPIEGIRAMVAKTGISAVQLHGDEPPAYADALEWPLIRAVDADDVEDACGAWSEQTVLLLDTIDPVRRGGTGVPVDWTLAVDITASDRLAALMPRGVIAVSESGLRSREELDRLAAAGYRAFLIGERFMTDPDPAAAIRRLISSPVARTV